jgi:hypothetical protein
VIPFENCSKNVSEQEMVMAKRTRNTHRHIFEQNRESSSGTSLTEHYVHDLSTTKRNGKVENEPKKPGGSTHFVTDDKPPLPRSFYLKYFDQGPMPGFHIPHDVLVKFQRMLARPF